MAVKKVSKEDVLKKVEKIKAPVKPIIQREDYVQKPIAEQVISKKPEPQKKGFLSNINESLNKLRGYEPGDEPVGTAMKVRKKDIPMVEGTLRNPQRGVDVFTRGAINVLGSRIPEKVSPVSEETKQRGAYIGGEVFGYVAPASGWSKAAGSIPVINKLAPKVGDTLLKSIFKKGLQVGTQEAVAGAGMGLAEGVGKGEDLKETLKRSGEYAVFGGIGGGIFGSGGEIIKNRKAILEGTKKFAKEVSESGLKDTLKTRKIDKGYQRIADEFIPKKVPEVPTKVPETPSFIREPAEQVGKAIPETTAPVKVASGIPETPSTIQEAVTPTVENIKPNPSGTKMSNRSAMTYKENNIGKKSINAYQVDYPEVKPYIQNYADWVLNKEFVGNQNYDRITPIMKKIKDETLMAPKDIKDGLERLIKDKGLENTANAKKVEVVIDDMLTNGFESSVTGKMPPDTDYLKIKSQIEGKNIIPEKRGSILDDQLIEDLTGTASIKFESIKTVDQLPKTREGLEEYVRQAQKIQDEGGFINLQMFAEAQKRLETSKLKETIKRSAIIKSDETMKAIDDIDMTYERKTNKETVDNAIERLQEDYQGVKDRILNEGLRSSEDTASAGIIMSNLEDVARKTGDVSELTSFIRKTRPMATELGQTVQAFRTWSKTASGSIMKAIGLFDNVTDDLVKTSSKYKGFDSEVADIKNVIKSKRDKVIDDAVDEFFDNVEKTKKTTSKDGMVKEKKGSGKVSNFPDMLAIKIEGFLKPKGTKEKSIVKQIINDLFGEAKDTIKATSNETGIKLPTKTAANTDIDRLANTYKFTEWGRKIRKNAYNMLKEEFRDDPQALRLLKDYFEKNKRPSNKAIFEKVLRSKLTGLPTTGEVGESVASNKQNIKNWIKNWHDSGKEANKEFIDSIVRESGLSGDDANALRNQLSVRMKDANKITKDELLSRIMAPTKEKGIPKRGTEKLTEYTNIGLLENQKFTDRINEKLSPVIKRILKDNNININDVARATVKDMKKARSTLLRDVFKNTRVDDVELNKLIRLVSDEFNKLTKDKKKQILQGLVKERKAPIKKGEIEKLIDKINLGVYDDSLDATINNLVREKYGLPYLSDDDAKFILKSYDELNKLNPQSREYKELVFDINDLITSKLPTDAVQKFGASQRLLFLTNLKSIAKSITNIVKGGEFMTSMITKPTVDLLTTGFRKYILSNPNAQRTVLFPSYDDVKSIAKAFGKGAKESLKDIKSYKDTSRAQSIYSDRYLRTKSFNNDNWIGKVLNRADFTTGKLYELFDRPFTEAIYEGRLREQMRAKGINKATPEIVEEALKYAEEMMGTGDNFLSEYIVGSIKKAHPVTNKTARKTIQVIAQYNLPFVRFASNEAIRIAQYNSTSFVQAITNLVKGNQAEFLKHINRGIYGTIGLQALGIVLAKNGLIPEGLTGRKEEYLGTETGEKKKGIKVGNKTYDISWAGAGASSLLNGARIYYESEKKDTVLEQFLEYASNPVTDSKYYTAPIESAINLGPSRNIKRILSAGYNEDVSLAEELFAGTARDIASGYTSPVLAKQIASYMDPYEREKGSAYKGEEILNVIKSGIPGLRQTLPEKPTILGEKKESYGKGITSFIDVFNTAEIKDNNTIRELSRLSKVGFDIHIPPKVPYKISSGEIDEFGKSIDIKFTAKDRSDYGILYGKILEEEYKKEFARPSYERVSDLEKAQRLQDAVGKAGTKAKKQFRDKLKK